MGDRNMKIEKLQPGQIEKIICWNDGKDEDFLRQWSGRGYAFPLTDEQIERRLEEGAEIFSACLQGEMIGTIELIRRSEDGAGLIGRFLLDPTRTGKGLGTAVLQAFMEYSRTVLGLSMLTLSVFDFNIGACRCYEKCGFEETERVTCPNGWVAIQMRKKL